MSSNSENDEKATEEQSTAAEDQETVRNYLNKILKLEYIFTDTLGALVRFNLTENPPHTNGMPNFALWWDGPTALFTARSEYIHHSKRQRHRKDFFRDFDVALRTLDFQQEIMKQGREAVENNLRLVEDELRRSRRRW